MDTLDAVQHNTSPNPHAPYLEKKKAPPLPICPGENFKKKKGGMEFSPFQHSLQPALFSLVCEKKKEEKRGEGEKKAPPFPICPGEDFKKKKEGMEFSQFQHSLQPALFSLVCEKKKRKKEGRETLSCSPPFPIGHFTLTQFLFGPSSRGQTLFIGLFLASPK